MSYNSIEEKPATQKNADTPELKREVIMRLLDIWLAHPNSRLWEIFKNADQPGGFPKPFEDRDLIHRLEDIYLKRTL